MIIHPQPSNKLKILQNLIKVGSPTHPLADVTAENRFYLNARECAEFSRRYYPMNYIRNASVPALFILVTSLTDVRCVLVLTQDFYNGAHNFRTSASNGIIIFVDFRFCQNMFSTLRSFRKSAWYR